MAYEQKPGQGSIFKNDKKEQENHPDYKGSITQLDGTQCWVSMWVKRSDGKPTFFSVSLKAKEDRPAQSAPTVTEEHCSDINDLPF